MNLPALWNGPFKADQVIDVTWKDGKTTRTVARCLNFSHPDIQHLTAIYDNSGKPLLHDHIDKETV